MKIFCEKVSQALKGEISPDRIQRIINLSNKRGIIFRGKSFFENLSQAEPEMMPVKHTTDSARVKNGWVVGKKIFGDLRDDGELVRWEAPFFCSSPSHLLAESEPQPRRFYWILELTSLEALSLIKPVREVQDAELMLDFLVPRNYLIRLKIVLLRKKSFNFEKTALFAQQLMFALIEQVMAGRYPLGGELVKFAIIK